MVKQPYNAEHKKNQSSLQNKLCHFCMIPNKHMAQHLEKCSNPPKNVQIQMKEYKDLQRDNIKKQQLKKLRKTICFKCGAIAPIYQMEYHLTKCRSDIITDVFCKEGVTQFKGCSILCFKKIQSRIKLIEHESHCTELYFLVQSVQDMRGDAILNQLQARILTQLQLQSIQSHNLLQDKVQY